MVRTLIATIVLSVTVVAQVELARVSRDIAKEPTYVGEPRYALFVFGDKAQARLWAVLDKSKKDLPYRDVLYFDVDGDGDLTDEGERFSGKYNAKGAAAGVAMRIVVPEFVEPGSFTTHKNLKVHPIPKKGRTGVYWTLMWRGQVEISGGYGPVGTNTTSWGKDKESAPVFRPTAEGKYGFGLYAWGDDHWKLKIGGADKVYVMIGSKGEGPDTLSVFDENYIDLEKNKLMVTLIAEAKDGGDIVVPVRIRNHC